MTEPSIEPMIPEAWKAPTVTSWCEDVKDERFVGQHRPVIEVRGRIDAAVGASNSGLFGLRSHGYR